MDVRNGRPLVSNRISHGVARHSHACPRSLEKGITADPWHSGKSIFPELATLRTDFLVWGVEWRSVAVKRLLSAREFNDPAYKWGTLDRAFAAADRHRVEIVPFVHGTPSWANGGRDRSFAPTNLSTTRTSWSR